MNEVINVGSDLQALKAPPHSPLLPPGICHTQEIKSVSRPHTLLVVLLPFGSTRACPALLARIRQHTRLLRAEPAGTILERNPSASARSPGAEGTAHGRAGAPGEAAGQRDGAIRARAPPAVPAARQARRRGAAPSPDGAERGPAALPAAADGPAPLTRCSCSGPGRAGGAAGALLPGPGARSLRHSNAAAVHAGPRALRHAPPRAPLGTAAPSAGRGLAPRPAPPRPGCVTARRRGLGGGAAQPGGSRECRVIPVVELGARALCLCAGRQCRAVVSSVQCSYWLRNPW